MFEELLGCGWNVGYPSEDVLNDWPSDGPYICCKLASPTESTYGERIRGCEVNGLLCADHIAREESDIGCMWK
jgi:hypothetical protein